nr:hypothetical protein 9 [Deltaproteobacteria bacterium]
MCEPVTMAVIATGATAASLYQADQQADASADAAYDAAVADINTIQEQISETSDAEMLEQLERSRQGLRERAALTVAAGEAGVVLPITALADSYLQEGYDATLIEANATSKLKQAGRAKDKVGATYAGRVKTANASRPSWLSGLQIVNAGVQGYSTGYQLQNS